MLKIFFVAFLRVKVSATNAAVFNAPLLCIQV